MSVKAEYGGTEGVTGDNLLENTIYVPKEGRSIDMERLKIGLSNKVLATEVLVVSNNVASWVWLTPLLGSRIVGIFLSETVSWIFPGGWREAAIQVIGCMTLVNAIHTIGME